MKPDQISAVHMYMDMITMYIDHIAHNVSDSEMIPFMCCSYFKVFEEAERDLHNYCDNVTGPETVEYIMGMVKATSADMIDLGCGKYSSVANCKVNLKQGMKLMEEMATPRSKIRNYGYSPVVPSVKVLQRLDKIGIN